MVPIAQGDKTTIYALPESFGRHVVKVGPFLAIHQETIVIQELTWAYGELHLPLRQGTPIRPRQLGLRGSKLPKIPEIRSKNVRAPWRWQHYYQQADSRGEQSGREAWDQIKDRISEEVNENNNKESKSTNGQGAIILRRSKY